MRFIIALLVLASGSLAQAQSLGNFNRYFPQASGTVTSITAGTGLTGGSITNTGTIALSVPVTIARGGTNATSASAARTSLGVAASGVNSDITSLTAISENGGIVFNDSQHPTPNTVTVAAPATVTNSYTITWPIGLCANNQPLVSDGSGNLGCGPDLSVVVTTATLNTDLAAIASKQIPVLVCATNMTLSGDGTCDGVLLSLLTYPQVLLVAQTDPTENGIWCTASGAWGRCGNMPDDTFSASGALVTVATGGGTTYDNTFWYVNGVGDGTIHAYQVPVTQGIARPYTNAGSCTVASTTLSTTATNLTCSGVPASAAVAVNCSGEAAFSTPTAGGIYCRATGTANQIACNTAVANTTAMAFACSWVRP